MANDRPLRAIDKTDVNNAIIEASRETDRRLYKEAYDLTDCRGGACAAHDGTRAERTTEHRPDGVTIEREGGREVLLTKGKDSFQIEYDRQGRISKVVENLDGQVRTMEAGKDFKLGDAAVGADGSLKVVSPDGKYSHTLQSDFSVTTKEIGAKADGSDDRVLRVRTREGVQREFHYDEKTHRLDAIVDRLHTNSGRDLVEVTRRLGTSNVWNLETNYGRSGLRTNLSLKENGDFQCEEIKRSRPNDLVHTDNSDGLHKDVAAAREHLSKLAQDKGVFGGSQSKVESWQKKFEQRCRDLAHEGRRAPSDEQIAKAYENLEKILSGSGNVSATHRRWLVESALREYAEPTKYINQGSHPSCCLAMTERHVVETHPDDHARVLAEAVNNKVVLAKVADGNGRRERLRLSEQQIQPDNEAASQARGGGWGAAWSYSNKIFQLAAINISYPNYHGNGYGFPGATIDQARHVNRFVDGEKTLPLVNRWYGGKPSFSSLQKALRDGVVGYFVPGHAMAIDKAKVENGVAYVHIDNWWGGTGDGWRAWSRI